MANCKKHLNTEEAWDVFNFAWNSVLYASSRVEYESAWDQINETYYLMHASIKTTNTDTKRAVPQIAASCGNVVK